MRNDCAHPLPQNGVSNLTDHTSSLPNPLSAALNAMQQLLSKGKPWRVSIEGDGLRATLIVETIVPAASTAALPDLLVPTEPMPATLATPTDEAILRVLGESQQSIKSITIAHRAGLTPNSYFRERLSQLVRSGRVEVCPDHKYQIVEEETAAGLDEGPVNLADCNTCRQAILAVLEQVRERMTGDQMTEWLKSHGNEYSKSSVQKMLVKLREEGVLDNISDDRGRGYGLTGWNCAS